MESRFGVALISSYTCRWGNKTEEIDKTLNVEQATYTRDAWVKAIYSKLFDYLGR